MVHAEIVTQLVREQVPDVAVNTQDRLGLPPTVPSPAPGKTRAKSDAEPDAKSAEPDGKPYAEPDGKPYAEPDGEPDR